MCLWDSEGNHVIRYNTVSSDDDHQYNDVFGAGHNFSTRGFPNRDSDIYGNLLSHCWDDAIESEGANCNVRIWGNCMTEVLVGAACASRSVGPLYVWRNITGVIRESPAKRSGAFLTTSQAIAGSGPDIGAQEAGSPPMEFGVDAYRNRTVSNPGAAVPTETSSLAEPYPRSPVITGLKWDDSVFKFKTRAGDNWPITWAEGDLQITVWGDGNGLLQAQMILSWTGNPVRSWQWNRTCADCSGSTGRIRARLHPV